MLQYVFYFVIYGFIGWVIDTTYISLRNLTFITKTYIIGFAGTYATGSLILIFLIKYIKKFNIFLKYFIYVISLTLLEYIASIWSEYVLGVRVWDYSNNFLNFQGRIDLCHAIFWGVLGLFFEYKLHPFISKFYKRYFK